MTELEVREKQELITDEDFDFLVWFDEQKKRYDVIVDKVKQQGHIFLEKNNLLEDGFKMTKDGVTVRVYETRPYIKKQIDTQALKDEGLYEMYTKDVEVKGSLRIQVDYED